MCRAWALVVGFLLDWWVQRLSQGGRGLGVRSVSIGANSTLSIWGQSTRMERKGMPGLKTCAVAGLHPGSLLRCTFVLFIWSGPSAAVTGSRKRWRKFNTFRGYFEASYGPDWRLNSTWKRRLVARDSTHLVWGPVECGWTGITWSGKSVRFS